MAEPTEVGIAGYQRGLVLDSQSCGEAVNIIEFVLGLNLGSAEGSLGVASIMRMGRYTAFTVASHNRKTALASTCRLHGSYSPSLRCSVSHLASRSGPSERQPMMRST